MTQRLPNYLAFIEEDEALKEEILRRAPPAPAEAMEFEADAFATLRRRAARDPGYEAIVRRFGRPVLNVIGGTFEPPTGRWHEILEDHQETLKRALRSVGRVNLTNHRMEWVGTAWMVAEDIAVTNRHVAEVFTRRRNGRFEIARNTFGAEIGVTIDFRKEVGSTEKHEAEVTEVLYVAPAGSGEPDLAFLRVRPLGGAALPEPLPLFEGEPRTRQVIAVMGYPAYDSRNDAGDMARIFGGVYDVKRIAPGWVAHVFSDGVLVHDATTLGGNSGSCVVDVQTGKVVGLHFAGSYLEANYAVGADTVARYLARFGDVVPDEPEPEPEPLPVGDEHGGYLPGFLGPEIPLPGLGETLAEVVTEVEGGGHELKYTNFSVVMRKDRKLAIYTAVNIDGESMRRLKRGRDKWYYDPRIPKELQFGNQLYKRNRLDRGHLVRRLDPAWGEHAKVAVEDTFCWTNCAPQWDRLNQRLWLGLESYLLESADTHGFRATVFSGPVYRDDDPDYRGAQVPQAFWKVAVMVREADRKLSATAYVVSQAHFLQDLEFVYGGYKTYQVAVRHVERLTGLDFGSLKDADPLGAVEGIPVRELGSSEDISL